MRYAREDTLEILSEMRARTWKDAWRWDCLLKSPSSLDMGRTFVLPFPHGARPYLVERRETFVGSERPYLVERRETFVGSELQEGDANIGFVPGERPHALVGVAGLEPGEEKIPPAAKDDQYYFYGFTRIYGGGPSTSSVDTTTD